MATKEKIFIGDTYPAVFECRKPNLDDPNDSRGLPATPTSAFARLMDTLDGTFLDIGGVGDTTDTVEIVPQTGSTPSDTGALLKYTVTADFTQVFGDLTLYITAIFSDGSILTEDVKIKILEFR